MQAAKRCLSHNYHMRVEITMQGKTLVFGPEDHNNRGWNQSWLLDAWVAGKGRQPFLLDVNNEIKKVADKFDEICKNEQRHCHVPGS